MIFDSFSGAAADLPKGRRSSEAVLAALRIDPRISTFDLSEHAWLRGIVDELKRDGRIVEDRSEPYPWHRYVVQEAQR